MDKSSNTASGTTHNNSTVQAENIVVKTGNDAAFSGANVNASDTLAMDIGGNLKVESLQDTDYAKGSNWGVNVGIGSNSAGGGFNTGKSNHDSAWVSDQTELTGGTVDINVAGKTTITGAEIASGNYDENGKFVDNGNLNLATNELEYNDLHDFNTSNESGFGVQTNIGGSTNKQGESFHPSGSTTISVKDTGYESEQINRATIGGGAITITGGSNSDLTGLNRDVSLAQELTKDLITGALNGSFTIDNRVFTETGWNDIISDHEVAAETALQAGGYIVDQVSKFMVDVFTSPPPSTTLSITFTNTQQFVNNLAREPLSLEEAPKFTYENGYLCSSSGNCIYDPPLEPIYWELDLAVGSAIGKFVIGPVVGAVAETAVGRAISSATSGVKSWFWGVFGKGGSQVTTHAAERSAERGVSNAAINNAIKKPLDTGPIKYDSLGRPSQKIIGKEATVIKNPETGKVITTYPTGSKVLKKLGETK
jgi:hypothetical protein